MRKLTLLISTLIISFATQASAQANAITWQSLTDEILVDILQTPRFKTMLQYTDLCSAGNLVHNIGLSPRAAVDFVRNTGGACNYTVQPSILRFSIDPRVYVPLFDPHNRVTLSSWTTPRNRTEIFFPLTERPSDQVAQIVNSRPILKNYLAQALAHELAIFLDSKQRILPGRESNMGWQLPRGSEYQQVIGALNPLPIVYSLAAIRAFQIEREVMMALANMFPTRYTYSNADYAFLTAFDQNPEHACGPLLTEVLIRPYDNIAIVVKDFVQLDFTLRGWTTGYEDSIEDLTSRHGAIATLTRIKVLPIEGGSPVSVCVAQARPRLSTQNIQFSNGPRPRMSGSSGGKRPRANGE